jgi:uncharacterized protein YdeI (YjbR/CyaY-like superfamily)
VERETIRLADRAQWRSWLADHHTTCAGAWAVFAKKSSREPGPAYEDLVEEALCFGWIDSTSGRVDDDFTSVYFAPRRKGGTWAATNKARVERLIAAGLMTEAGMAAIEQARADGSWSRLDAIDSATVPDDLAAAFERLPGSREQFDSFSLSTRRQLLFWVVDAKRPATRQRRIDETARLAQQGIRANGQRSRDAS